MLFILISNGLRMILTRQQQATQTKLSGRSVAQLETYLFQYHRSCQQDEMKWFTEWVRILYSTQFIGEVVMAYLYQINVN